MLTRVAQTRAPGSETTGSVLGRALATPGEPPRFFEQGLDPLRLAVGVFEPGVALDFRLQRAAWPANYFLSFGSMTVISLRRTGSFSQFSISIVSVFGSKVSLARGMALPWPLPVAGRRISASENW